jgi:prepilin-type N-terminal cleavage/methylation domain-containing protein
MPHSRRGMTLVELLVVVAILGVLAVTVIPLLGNSAESRKTREAARSVVSYVAQSQNRVLGRTEWGGFWIVPVSNTNYALDLFAADVPRIFQGDSLPALVTGSFSSAADTFVLSSGSFGGSSVSMTNGTINTGDLVRFDGTGPWYCLVNSTSVCLRDGRIIGASPPIENAYQTSLNTPWPAASVRHTYELMRQPLRSGSPLPLGSERCVDVAQSGYDGAGGYIPFGNTPGDIAVLFDGTGRLRQMMVGQKRITPIGGVYLLVGRPDRAVASPPSLASTDDSTGYNWQYSDSYWIGIEPFTGVTKIAESLPVAVPAHATSQQITTATVNSQSYIRSELLATGR